MAYSSRTVYVGNLSFTTTDFQLYSLFSPFGSIERVVMGLNRIKKTPCGFGFIIFKTREAAIAAVQCGSSMHVNGRVLQVQLDKGYHPGRKWGRGEDGNQVIDTIRAQAREKTRGSGRRSRRGRW